MRASGSYLQPYGNSIYCFPDIPTRKPLVLDAGVFSSVLAQTRMKMDTSQLHQSKLHLHVRLPSRNQRPKRDQPAGHEGGSCRL